MLLTPATPALQPQTRAEMLDRLSDQQLAGFSASVLSARYVDTAGARHEIPPPDIDGALQDPLGRSACTLAWSAPRLWGRVLMQVFAFALGGAACCLANAVTRLEQLAVLRRRL